MIKRVLSLFWVAVFVVALSPTPKVLFATTEIIVDLSWSGVTNERLAEMVANEDIPHNTTHLYLGGNPLTDISPLAYLTNLNILFLGGWDIVDITPLSSLTNLRELRIIETDVSDISPLETLVKLERLLLSDNNISDISPLSGLVNLRLLDLSRNPITRREVERLRNRLPMTGIVFDWIPRPGHVLGNDYISIGDALQILRHVSGLPSILDDSGGPYVDSAFLSAFIVREFEHGLRPTIEDAIEILRYLVGLPSALDNR